MILAGEGVFPLGLAQNVQYRKRFPFRMQCLSGLTDNPTSFPERANDVGLIFFGNGRESEDLPVTAAEDVSGQVVFMESLHDNDDAATSLIVETGNQGVVIPVVHRFTLRF